MKHTTVWIREDEWVRMNSLSASSGQFLSRWVANKVLAFGTQHPNQAPHRIERTTLSRGRSARRRNEIVGRARPFAFQDNELEKMKTMAANANMNFSQYMLGIVFEDEYNSPDAATSTVAGATSTSAEVGEVQQASLQQAPQINQLNQSQLTQLEQSA